MPPSHPHQSPGNLPRSRRRAVWATVLLTTLAVLFASIGCLLIVRGLMFFPGVLLVGRHGLAAAAITFLAGILSLIITAGLCFPFVSLIEHRRSRLGTNRFPHIEADLHVLAAEEGYDGSPVHSGFRATLRCENVDADANRLSDA